MRILRLNENPHMIDRAARWFHQKWQIPIRDYQESMQESLKDEKDIPKWYIMVNHQDEIIAGAGVIENDFHQRQDLTPNICAVYVEEKYRGHQLGKDILAYIRKDLGSMGYQKVYLVSDHMGFYEKYDWEFLTTVKDIDDQEIRMYQANTF